METTVLTQGNWFTFAYSLISLNVRAEAWQSVVLLSSLYPNNLFPVSIFLIVPSGILILLASVMGWLVGRVRPRKILVFVLLCLQTLGLCSVLAALNAYRDDIFPLVIIFESITRLANMGIQLAVEKDWAMEISSDPEDLAKLNSKLKFVDLSLNLFSPLLISQLSIWTSKKVATFTVIGLRVISLIATCLILHFKIDVVKESPSSEILEDSIQTLLREDKATQDTENYEVRITESEESKITYKELFTNSAMITSIAASLLYANILNPGSIVISYLLFQGLPSNLVSVITASAVVSGLFAVLLFSHIIGKLGLVKWALTSIWLQIISLTLTCISFLFQSHEIRISMFSIGIVISRFPLWSFDMSQSQHLQQLLPNDIGQVFGIQLALQNLFEIMGYMLTIIWPSPDVFYIPTFISFGIVLVAAILFTIYSFLFAQKANSERSY